jgi:hypothetical protein
MPRLVSPMGSSPDRCRANQHTDCRRTDGSKPMRLAVKMAVSSHSRPRIRARSPPSRAGKCLVRWFFLARLAILCASASQVGHDPDDVSGFRPGFAWVQAAAPLAGRRRQVGNRSTMVWRRGHEFQASNTRANRRCSMSALTPYPTLVCPSGLIGASTSIADELTRPCCLDRSAATSRRSRRRGRCSLVDSPWLRPWSSTARSAPRTTGMIVASQAMRRMVSGDSGVPAAIDPLWTSWGHDQVTIPEGPTRFETHPPAASSPAARINSTHL